MRGETGRRAPARGQGNGAGETAGRLLQLLGKDHLGGDVLHTIAGLDGDVVPVLGTIATGEWPADSYQRQNAIYVLGRLGRVDGVTYLARVLGIPDVNLQVLAARALGRIGSPDALTTLRRLYNGYPAPGAPPPPGAEAGEAATWPAPDQPHFGAAPPAEPPSPAPTTAGPLPPALALELRDILDPAGPSGGSGEA